MTRSMTGFGRAEEIADSKKISVECKSVNHRYLDLNIKMPRRFQAFEADIREVLKGYMQRGKVDIYIALEEDGGKKIDLVLNRDLAGKYVRYARELERELGVPNDLTASRLLHFPEVVSLRESLEEGEDSKVRVLACLHKACRAFVLSREREGEKLQEDLLCKLSLLDEILGQIDARYPEVLVGYRERLEQRVTELLENAALDPGRIGAEVTLYADKTCVDEELVRLKSHVKAMEGELQASQSVGRKLDFLAQEMNREANTILSKSTDLQVVDLAIVMKTEIEKIREQIQNIE